MLRGGLVHIARHGGNPLCYMRWVPKAAHDLHDLLPESVIERLVLTRGYERIAAVHASGASQDINALVDYEVHVRSSEIRKVLRDLEQRIDQWNDSERFVAFDTNVFLHHANKLEEIDFGAIAPVGVTDISTGVTEAHDPAKPVRLLVPMVVVDELDEKKLIKDPHLRWRARHSLRALDRALPDPYQPGVLREAGYLGVDGEARGEVTVELLLDPPGHVRLPIADDEIIDRLKVAEDLAAQPICLVTHDTGCAMRARAVGLIADNLPMPERVQPDTEVAPDSRRSRRRGTAATE